MCSVHFPFDPLCNIIKIIKSQYWNQRRNIAIKWNEKTKCVSRAEEKKWNDMHPSELANQFCFSLVTYFPSPTQANSIWQCSLNGILKCLAAARQINLNEYSDGTSKLKKKSWFSPSLLQFHFNVLFFSPAISATAGTFLLCCVVFGSNRMENSPEHPPQTVHFVGLNYLFFNNDSDSTSFGWDCLLSLISVFPFLFFGRWNYRVQRFWWKFNHWTQ